MIRVFISFDYDHDKERRIHLVAQAKNPDSQFQITDYSMQQRSNSNWRKTARQRIRESDLTIVIFGEHTHDAKGVAAEVTMPRETTVKGPRGCPRKQNKEASIYNTA